MLDPHGGERPGLFAALRRIAATLLASVRTRLELLANELEEGRLRIQRQLMLALAAFFSLLLAVVFAVGFLVVAFWESRGFVLGAATLACLALAAGFGLALRNSLKQSSGLIAASLAELDADLDRLQETDDDEPPR